MQTYVAHSWSKIATVFRIVFQDAGSTLRILFLVHGHTKGDPRIRLTRVKCVLGAACDGILDERWYKGKYTESMVGWLATHDHYAFHS